jgi:Skp family chaperone for outer membrane proteins
MKVRLAWAAGLLAMLSLAFLTRPAMADDQPPLKVGVCDPLKVIRECQEGKDVESKLKQDTETLNNQLDIKKKQLETKQDELKLLLPTSPDYQTKMDDLTSTQAQTQAWFQSTQVIMARKQKLEEDQLFDKVLKAVSDVAKSQGMTVVLNSAQPDFPEPDRMDANVFIQTILMHSSLYHDPGMDITEKVVIAMDKSYSTSH